MTCVPTRVLKICLSGEEVASIFEVGNIAKGC